MPRLLLILTTLLLSLPTMSQTKIRIHIDGRSFQATIDDTETGRAFLGKLPLTLDMSELNGNEYYCYGLSLPTAARHYATVDAGQLMLYGSDCLVLFYGRAGGYSYTPIGRLADTAALADALQAARGHVTFSLPTSGVGSVSADPGSAGLLYAPSGRRLEEAPSGRIYISRGKKLIRR